ncbi:GTPase [Pelagibius sp. CAU 1746]|uniref:flagellar biosynthesis protein FlhF n=1 Tax=Pelagibius sp. CAU 1746 TaxID=3140370 RepID=UPI00325AE968
MLLRTFTARTATEAMQQVREVLGDEAIILSTQDDDTGIKVTAALEPANGAVPEAAPDRRESWEELEAADRIAEVLDHHRVPRGLADRLLNAAANTSTDDWMMAFAAALDHELSFLPLGDIGPERPVMLVGPSGAGKSVTAAKLCACARLAEGRSLLITMDGGKAGGRAQAETFTKALDARLVCAEDAAAVGAAAAARANDEIAIIDTVGCNPFDAAERGALREAANAAGAAMALVLPAGGDPAETADMALAFAEEGVRCLIPTRLDSARRFGGLISAAHVGGMSFLAAGVSRHIGGGLVAVNPVSLARLLSSRAPFQASTLLAAD